MYNLFAKHDICPDSFYGVERGYMARCMILAFSSYEIEEENKAAEKAQKGAN